MTIKQKIRPCLWFDNNVEEAIGFYSSIFKNTRVLTKSYYADSDQLPKGTLLTATFELAGQQFLALNGGPMFKFTEAISFMVSCDSQAEIDELWEKLIEGGGQHSECGWLKDKFGLSWQIIPAQLDEWISGDPKKSAAVMKVVMKMKKLIIADMEKAYKGG